MVPLVLDKIAIASSSLGVPVLLAQYYGLIGSVWLQSKPLPILQPKPGSSRPDLRLVKPFPALQVLSDTINWANLESHEHSHVPYPLILLKVAREYMSTVGHLPKTFAKKQDFQNMIKSMSQDFHAEENFAQAHKHAYLAYSPLELDLDHLGALRDHSKENAPVLHSMLLALDQFVGKTGTAPLSGTIPDMVSSTSSYLELQCCYQRQAQEDWKMMRELTDPSVPDTMLTTFIQNVHNIDLLHIRSLADTSAGMPDKLVEELNMALMEVHQNLEQTPLVVYLGVEACQRFHRA